MKKIFLPLAPKSLEHPAHKSPGPYWDLFVPLVTKGLREENLNAEYSFAHFLFTF